MTASAMKKTSAKFAGAANALHAEANQMNRLIAEYVAAGHQAAWMAAYKADPDALPPPPTNPNYAFTPPPPALLQTKDTAIEAAAGRQADEGSAVLETAIARAESEGIQQGMKEQALKAMT